MTINMHSAPECEWRPGRRAQSPIAASATCRLLVAVALSCAAAGCQSQSGSTSASGSGPDKATPSASPAAKPIDACSMVPQQDVSSILGVSVSGKAGASKDPRIGGCTWENPSTDESITLEIGQPGTAPHNTLPPPEAGFPNAGKAGPDGMRLLGSGMVEFAAGNRDNTLQVAVLKLSADQANSAAIELARKVAPQVPQ